MMKSTRPGIFGDWVEVKKKRKKQNQTETNEKNTSTSHTLNSNVERLSGSTESIGNDLPLDCRDYRIKQKSKKKKKQQRDRDNDLADSFSKLKTGDVAAKNTISKFKGVQNSSKSIKKEKRSEIKKPHLKKGLINVDLGYPLVDLKGSKEEKKEQADNSTSDSDHQYGNEREHNDSLTEQIADIIRKHPSKKFKLISGELTQIQSKRLKKSGLNVKIKSKRRNKKQKMKERAQLNKISKKIEKSLLLID